MAQPHPPPDLQLFTFHNFLLHTHETYSNIKQHLQPSSNQQHHKQVKFSSHFQNEYAQLSAKFDEMISKTGIGFEEHKSVLEDEQELIQHVVVGMNPTLHQYFIDLLVKVLIGCEQWCQKWMNEEVSNLKEQLDLVILKNSQFEQQITQLYQEYEQLRQKLQDQMSNRFERQKYCRSLEKDRFQLQHKCKSLQKQCRSLQNSLQFLQQTNQHIIHSNHSLTLSVKTLDQQMQSTKQAQRIITHTELAQKRKANQLQQQNQRLQMIVERLEEDIIELKQQQEQYINQITRLTERIQFHQDQLNFYKGKDLRQSQEIIQQSFDRLNKYQHLMESYQNSSHKGSLKSFILSHQKSMGRLTIFESKQYTQHKGYDEKRYQKISNPDIQLKSFDHIQNIRLNQEPNQSFNFPDFNQLTFRPQADRQVASSEQLNSKQEWNMQRSRQSSKPSLVYRQDIGNETGRFQVDSFSRELYGQRQQVYVEPIKISGNKHRRQRSQSITEGSPALITKRLVYQSRVVVINEDEARQVQIAENRKEEDEPEDEDEDLEGQNVQQSEQSSVPSLNKINGLKGMRKMASCAKLLTRQGPNQRSCMKLGGEQKEEESCHKETDNRSLLGKGSFRAIESRKQLEDNRSEANSVNKALIKKSIRVEKQLQELKDKLQAAQVKLENNQYVMQELKEQIKFYKLELSKNIQGNIRMKSEIDAYKQEVDSLEEFNSQFKDTYDEKCNELEESENRIEELLTVIQQAGIKYKRLQGKLLEVQKQKHQKEKQFQDRLLRVKEYCRSYMERKQQQHAQQIQQIQNLYQLQITAANQNITQLNQQILKINTINSEQFLPSNSEQFLPQSTLFSNKSLKINQKHNKLICQRVSELSIIHKMREKKSCESQTYQNLCIKKLSFNSSQVYQQICPTPKHLSLNQINQLSYKITPTHSCINSFTIIPNTVNQNIYPYLKQYFLSISNQLSFNVFAQSKITQPNQKHPNKFTVNPAFSQCIIAKPQCTKSPLMEKKQFLNTPSQFTTLQSKKLSPQTFSHPTNHHSHSSHQKNSSHSSISKNQRRSSSPYNNNFASPCNINNEFNPNPIHLHIQQDEHNAQNDPNQTFLTVDFQRNSQLKKPKHQQKKQISQQPNECISSQDNQSFYTCIPFSSSQSLPQNIYIKQTDKNQVLMGQNENNQMILEQDIFQLNNQCSNQIDSLQTSELFQTNNIQGIQEVKNEEKLEVKVEDKLENKEEPTLYQQLQYQIPLYSQDKPQIQLQKMQKTTQCQQPQEKLHIKSQFPMSLNSLNSESTKMSLKLYSQMFQKHLYPLFKKNTTFNIISVPLPSEQIPHHQKMYLLHTQKLSKSKNDKPKSKSSIPTKTRFLLYEKLLINLQTQQKLQIPHQNQLKFILDSNKLVLGNFQILITNDNLLKITRNNKRCSYFGNIPDAIYEIHMIEQVALSKPGPKK